MAATQLLEVVGAVLPVDFGGLERAAVLEGLVQLLVPRLPDRLPLLTSLAERCLSDDSAGNARALPLECLRSALCVTETEGEVFDAPGRDCCYHAIMRDLCVPRLAAPETALETLPLLVPLLRSQPARCCLTEWLRAALSPTLPSDADVNHDQTALRIVQHLVHCPGLVLEPDIVAAAFHRITQLLLVEAGEGGESEAVTSMTQLLFVLARQVAAGLPAVWALAQQLLSSPLPGRRDRAYPLLCRLYQAASLSDLSVLALDLRRESAFWRGIQEGLRGDDTATAKRALSLLKRAVADSDVPMQPPVQYCDLFAMGPGRLRGRWQAFVSVYESTDAASLHLIQPTWSQLPILFDTVDGEAFPFHPSWVWLLYQRCLRHRNELVRRMALLSFLEFDFQRYAPWMSPAVVCEVLLHAAEPWMYRTRISLEAGPVKAAKGKGGQAIAAEDVVDWRGRLKACLLRFCRAYAAALPPDGRRGFIGELLRAALGRPLHCTAASVVVRVLLCIERPSGQPSLLSVETLLLLEEFVSTRVQGHFPLWLEVRLLATVLHLLPRLMDPPAAAAELDALAGLLAALGRAGSVGHRVDQCGPSGGLGSALALRRLPQCQRWVTQWLAGAPGPLVAHAAAQLEALQWLPPATPLRAVHRLAQRAVLWWPACPATDVERLLHAALELVRGCGPDACPEAAVRGLVLIQEALLWCGAEAGSAPQRTVGEAVAAAWPTLGPALHHLCRRPLPPDAGGPPRPWPPLPEALDVAAGLFYAALRHLPAPPLPAVLEDFRAATTDAVDCIVHSSPRLGSAGQVDVACCVANLALRNALWVLQTACLLHIEGRLDLGALLEDDARVRALVQSLLVVRPSPIPSKDRLAALDCPLPLGSVLWPFLMDQLHRCRWNCVVVLFELWCRSCGSVLERQRFALEVLELALEQLPCASTNNMAVVLDVARAAAPHCGRIPDAVLPALLAATATHEELQRREAARAHATAASLLCDPRVLAAVGPEGRRAMAARAAQLVAGREEVPPRVFYAAAVPLCGHLLRQAAAEAPGTEDGLLASCDLFGELLLQLLVLSVPTGASLKTEDEDHELVAELTAPPPSLGLEEQYPPATHLEDVARASVLATLRDIARRHHAATGATHPAVLKVVRQLLRASEREELSTACVMPNSFAHRARVRVWQTLCCLAPYLDEAAVADLAPPLLEALRMTNTGSVRRYIELFAIAGALGCGGLLHAVAAALQAPDWPAQAQCSLLAVAGHALWLAYHPALAQLLVPPLVCCLTSNQPTVRLHAQVLLHHAAQEVGDRLWRDAFGSADFPPLAALLRFIAAQPDVAEARATLEGQALYSWPADVSLASLLAQRRKEGSQWVEECLAPHLFEAVAHAAPYLDTVLASLSPFDAARTATLHPLPALVDGLPSALPPEPPGTAASAPAPGETLDVAVAVGAAAGSNFQMKVEPWSEEDLEAMTNPRSLAQKRARHPIVVLASLVDDVHTLAALARCTEVFLGHSIVISDKKVLARPEFAATSVTAEQWLPITAIPRAEVAAWLAWQKARGWTVLAVERSARSHVLHEFAFAGQRCILLVGANGGGIPLELLPFVDHALALPSSSPFADLSLQVGAALALYEGVARRPALLLDC